MSDEIVVSNEPSGSLHQSAMAIGLGESFGLDARQVINVLRRQIIKVEQGAPEATAAELVVVMSVLKKYELDPMMKQVYAWRDRRGDLAVVLSIDGWLDIARRNNPSFTHMSYEYGPDVPSPDGKGKTCAEWVRVTVHDSIRGKVEQPPVYYDEWYQKQTGNYAGPWQKQPRHKMNVLSSRLALRLVYGLAGLDVRDPEDFAPAQYTVAASATADRADQLAAQLAEAKGATSPGPLQSIEFVNGGKIELMDDGGGPLVGTGLNVTVTDLSFWTCPMCQTENDGAECVRCGAPLLTPDEPESAQGHMLIDPPKSRHEGACAAVGCIKAWSLRCAMCGERFCTEHMHENRVKCKVCGGGE